MFTRRNHAVAGDCCESGVITGTPVEVATPATVSTPGAITYPPPSTSRAVVVPNASDPPMDLNPVDPTAKSKLGPPPGNGAVRAGPQGASYQTRNQDSGARIARRRTDSFGTTTVSTPEPTGRSSPGRNRADQSDQTGAESDPLDNIPPLDLPGEVSRSKATPPVPPAAPAAAAPAAARPGDVKTESPAPPASDLDLTSVTLTVPPASVGPGLSRFLAVDLKLAGGSLPTPASLDWLVEKGYRTLLDLRESSEVSPAFIAEVTKRGLRYVALPIGPGSIDQEHVSRFAYEVAARDARPMYFFDSDGTRSGALWYIRRIATDRADRQVAMREAEELGLSDQTAYWSAVTKYVSTLKPAATGSSSSNPRAKAGDPAVSLADLP